MLRKYWSLFSSLPSKDIQLCFNPSKNRGEFFFKRENFGGKSIDITVLCRNGFSPRTRQGYQQSLASLLQILGVLAIVIRQEKSEVVKSKKKIKLSLNVDDTLPRKFHVISSSFPDKENQQNFKDTHKISCISIC